MDFSAWDWTNTFRIHDAACLIAGVMPLSKRFPTSEELPPQARPILIALGSAYYEWFFQTKNPERPRTVVLEGVLNDDGTLPTFPVPGVLAGELVSRAALHSYITATGRKSAYSFGPIDSTEVAAQHQPAAAPARPRAHNRAASDASDWKAKAQSRAAEIITHQKAKDLYPSQQHIADQIAREFRDAGVVGADGKPLTGAYIKRHALQGITSAVGKRLSTSNRRGK